MKKVFECEWFRWQLTDRGRMRVGELLSVRSVRHNKVCVGVEYYEAEHGAGA